MDKINEVSVQYKQLEEESASGNASVNCKKVR